MRLLAIEDNRDILANVADYLEAKGYTVDCAGNGPTACISPSPMPTI
jgi:DNA-binding response OmpR family regulator